MRIVRVRIQNFRCIRQAELFPAQHNVLLGPNNSGKTAVLEGLNLLLNPEISTYSHAIDENDFFCRIYQTMPVPGTPTGPAPAAGLGTASMPPAAPPVDPIPPIPAPVIRIEAVLADLKEEDEDLFRDWLVPWCDAPPGVIEATEEGQDPFANAKTAIRVVFEAWYDAEEDDFFYETFFLPSEALAREDCQRLTKEHKRHIGFLIYRDFRALTRPVNLDPGALFGRLLQSQDVAPQHFEEVLRHLRGALDPMTLEPDFGSVLTAYKAELERYLLLSPTSTSRLSFELTDGTRSQLKEIAQMYALDTVPLPLQTSGAGTRSLAILAFLTLIMRRRGRGILALEEPETFLFPHAQRRVIDECLTLASQSFVTTHSPYVLERMPVEGVGRIERQLDGAVTWNVLPADNVKQVNLYSRRLHHGFCEALLGRGAVVVEGDSDRWWIAAASRILDGKVWNNRRCEAFELQGIAVVSADTNGDICKTGKFFADAGLKVVAVVDSISDATLVADLCAGGFPAIFLKQTGLEDVLARNLPIALVRRILTEAPHSKTPLTAAADVSAMTEPDARDGCREMLIRNKGSHFLHEWIISQVDEASLPDALKDIVDMVLGYVVADTEVGTCSLIR